MKRIATLAFVLLSTTAALAQSGGGPMGKPRMPGPGPEGPGVGGPMDRNLFPPEMVLMNQLALGLSAEQVATVKKLVGETQGRVLDVQVDLHRVTEQLQAALEPAKVDESAAISLASQAMDLEKKIKTAHLALMIRVKNLLTDEQQAKARALTPEKRGRVRPLPPTED